MLLPGLQLMLVLSFNFTLQLRYVAFIVAGQGMVIGNIKGISGHFYKVADGRNSLCHPGFRRGFSVGVL